MRYERWLDMRREDPGKREPEFAGRILPSHPPGSDPPIMNCAGKMGGEDGEIGRPPRAESSPRVHRAGRGGGIRTPDPLLPKQMRYQTALRPDS